MLKKKVVSQVKLESKCILGLKSFLKCNCTKLTENQFLLIPGVLTVQLIICTLNLKCLEAIWWRWHTSGPRAHMHHLRVPSLVTLGKSLQPSMSCPDTVYTGVSSILPAASHCPPCCSQHSDQRTTPSCWMTVVRWVWKMGGHTRELWRENHAGWGLWGSLEKTTHAFPES